MLCQARCLCNLAIITGLCSNDTYFSDSLQLVPVCINIFMSCRRKIFASSYFVLLQITEAVASLVASLKGDSQGSATQALLEPILQPLQACLQQPQQLGAGPGQQASDNVEYVGALVDRLSTVFK